MDVQAISFRGLRVVCLGKSQTGRSRSLKVEVAHA